MKQNTLWIIPFALTVILLESCNYFGGRNTDKEEQILTRQIYNSYASTGKHGYFTITSIVGRIKTVPIINGLPFKINVVKISPELLRKQIRFKIEDSLTYTISYPKNEKEDGILKGIFGKNISNEKVQLIVTKAGSFLNSSNPEVSESLKQIDYVFKVDTY